MAGTTIIAKARNNNIKGQYEININKQKKNPKKYDIHTYINYYTCIYISHTRYDTVMLCKISLQIIHQKITRPVDLIDDKYNFTAVILRL